MRKGFTLVELLAVIIIVGMLVSFAVSNYQGSRDRNKINEAVSIAESAFNTVRTNALTGSKDNSSYLPTNYGLNFNSGQNTISIFAEKGSDYLIDNPDYNKDFINNVYDSDLEADELIKTISMPTDFLISSISGTVDNETWINTYTGFDLSFFLPRADLILTANSVEQSTVCLDLSDDDSFLRSMSISRATGQIIFSKTQCQ